MFKRKFFSRHVLPLLVLVLCQQAQATTADAQAIVQQASMELRDRLMGLGLTLQNDPASVYDEVAACFLPNMNFKRVGEITLGDSWNKASPAQKSRFIAAFQNLFIQAYAQGLLSKAKSTFTITNVSEHHKRIKITLAIGLGNGKNTVSYYLGHKDERWKIYDVKIDGVSMLTTFQFAFQNKIQKQGLEQLIQDLETSH